MTTVQCQEVQHHIAQIFYAPDSILNLSYCVVYIIAMYTLVCICVC